MYTNSGLYSTLCTWFDFQMSEFRKLLSSIGEPLTDEQLDEMLRKFETDGDGLVKYEGKVKAKDLHLFPKLR